MDRYAMWMAYRVRSEDCEIVGVDGVLARIWIGSRIVSLRMYIVLRT